MNDNMTDSMWIKANLTRNYRIRRWGEMDNLGLVAAIIVRIDADRQGCTMRDIRMRNELPDTDEAAVLALKENEAIMRARLGKVYGLPMSARAVVNQLRQDEADLR